MARPLLSADRTRVSAGRDGVVELVRELDPAHDLYLEDHRLDGRPVLPFAVAVELMSEVVAQGWSTLEVVGLRDVQLLHGIVLRDRTESVRVTARPEVVRRGEPVWVGVEIVSATKPARVHYRAAVELARSLPDPPSPEPVPTDLTQSFALSVEEAYRRWLFHGPRLRSIAQIEWIGPTGIKGSLAVSAPRLWLAGAPAGPWLIDRGIVDGGLQLLILWVRERMDMTALPSRFRRYRRFGSPAGPLIDCEIRIRPETSGHILHADVLFLGPTGRMVGTLEDMEGTCSKELNRLSGNSPLVRSA